MSVRDDPSVDKEVRSPHGHLKAQEHLHGASGRGDEDDVSQDESASTKLLREDGNVNDDSRDNSERDDTQPGSSQHQHQSEDDDTDQSAPTTDGGPLEPRDGKEASRWSSDGEAGVALLPSPPEAELSSSPGRDVCATDKPNHEPTTRDSRKAVQTLSCGPNDLDPDLGNDLDPDDPDTSDLEEGESLASLRKNVGVLCLSFLLLFTAYMSLSGLLTSLHPDEGVGAGSLAIICGVMIPSSLFLPPVLIAKLGCKWTLVLSISGYVIFIMANFHATWWLMAPASAILGLVAPCLWSAKCIYLTEAAVRWAKLTRSSPTAVIARFFGIFFMMFQSSIVWGNIVSSQVFTPAGKNESGVSVSDDVDADVMMCGAAFCPWTSLNQTALLPPEAWQIYVLCGFFMAVTLIAGILIAIVLDPMTSRRRDVRPTSPLQLLIVASRHLLRSRMQQLLVPLTVYEGLQSAFLYADLTQSYAGCTLGVWKIGYVMVCLGVVDALTSMLAGRLVQYVGNLTVLTAGGIIHLGVLLTLLLWRPDPRAEYVVFIVSALYGMGDGIMQTNTNAVYGAAFAENSEAAFANLRVWESVGTLLPFVYSKLLCTDVKIYISIASLALGMLGFYAAEFHRRCSRETKPLHSSDVVAMRSEELQTCE